MDASILLIALLIYIPIAGLILIGNIQQRKRMEAIYLKSVRALELARITRIRRR